jgi:hypothetical protein
VEASAQVSKIVDAAALRVRRAKKIGENTISYIRQKIVPLQILDKCANEFGNDSLIDSV